MDKHNSTWELFLDEGEVKLTPYRKKKKSLQDIWGYMDKSKCKK